MKVDVKFIVAVVLGVFLLSAAVTLAQDDAVPEDTERLLKELTVQVLLEREQRLVMELELLRMSFEKAKKQLEEVRLELQKYQEPDANKEVNDVDKR